MPRLLVISSARAALLDGKPFLGVKFVEGMRYYRDLWGGPVGCVLKTRQGTFPYGRSFELDELPFDVTFLPPGKRIDIEEIGGHDIVLCGGDDREFLHVADICRNAGKKLAFIIEYTPETRRQILFLDPSRNLPKKIYSLLWNMHQERRRRRAFKIADGIQANGYPALAAYGPVNANTMMYLDNRVGEDLLATEHEMTARETRLAEGGSLRLVHSGRLEPLKGSQDLVAIARRLKSKGVDFTLDIFGAGSLEDEIRAGISEHGLQGRVRLNGAVDFETGLVPFARTRADIYLSCHRQSDPSCTYVESMGCGLAVAGYSNRMWSALCRESGAGWVAPLGDADALADTVHEAAQNRSRLAAACRSARSFAGAHNFENEFHRRIDHLKALAGTPAPPGDRI